MAIERFYISCTKKVPTVTLNSTNRPVTTYTDSTINGYLGSGSNVIITITGKDTIETQYKFYCDDFSIAIGDFIIYEGKTYEVLSEPRNTVHKSHHIKTMLRKVDGVKQII